MLPFILEYNLCFNKDAFIKSKLRISDYWMRALTGELFDEPLVDIGYYIRYALNPRWEKDMLVYTRLPTHDFSLKKSIYFLRYMKKGNLVALVRRIHKE